MPHDIALVLESSPAFFAGAAFVIGLMIGSFLNVVIYRLPIILDRQWQAQAAELLSAPDLPGSMTEERATSRFTLSFPLSACPVCKTPIAAWHNVPILSWLYLRGKCAACKTPISLRYPLVELSTAVLSGWVAWHFGYGASAACALIVTWALIAMTGIDFDHQLLPDDLTLPLMWGGLVAAVTLAGAETSIPVTPTAAVIGSAAGYLSLWLVFQTFRLVTGKEGMGYGDFKLFAALGAWLGWKMLPLIILLAAATGAVVGVAMIVLRGRDRTTPMPFGPYLAAAGWLAMMYGDTLVTGYLQLRVLSIKATAERLKVGMTGGIASGKSTVAQRFRELGVTVIDADDSARSVVEPGQPGLTAVIEEFGSGFLTASGELNRRKLRELIFTDPTARHRLEARLHPLIRADMDLRSLEVSTPYLILAIPLLIEKFEPDRVNRVLVIDLPEALQLERVTARDGVSWDQARAILAAQASREARLACADDVLVNSGSVSTLRQGVDDLHRKYLGLLAQRRAGQ